MDIGWEMGVLTAKSEQASQRAQHDGGEAMNHPPGQFRAQGSLWSQAALQWAQPTNQAFLEQHQDRDPAIHKAPDRGNECKCARSSPDCQHPPDDEFRPHRRVCDQAVVTLGEVLRVSAGGDAFQYAVDYQRFPVLPDDQVAGAKVILLGCNQYLVARAQERQHTLARDRPTLRPNIQGGGDDLFLICHELSVPDLYLLVNKLCGNFRWRSPSCQGEDCFASS